MKIFKKALCIFLIVVMCLTSAPLQGFVGLEWPSLPEINFGEFELPKIDFSSWFGSLAKAVTITDQCGDNVYYTYDTETQELVVSGSGAIWDYEMGESPASDVAIKSVVIEEGITYIGEYAFYDCDELINVDIREGLTEVGYGAFMNCKKLTDVIAPSSITTVGEAAFYGCKSLKNLYFCGSLEQSYNISFEIFNDALFDSWIHYDYYSYEHKFTSEVTKIASCIEEGEKIYTCECGGLFIEYLPIKNHQDDNNDGLCDNCNYKSTLFGTCGENVFWTIFENCLLIYGEGEMYNYNTTISPFYKRNFESVVIKYGVTTIGTYVFECCSGLETITIPDSVTTIGDMAFYYCESLTSVTIPDSVTTIGDYAFAYCDSLTSIFVDINNSAYSNDSRGVLFNKNKTMLIQYPTGNTGTSYTIPDSVTTIDEWAFDDCNSLTSVTIPDSVTTIGERAFTDCDSLTSVTIPDSVTTIGDFAFACCYRLTSVTIPDSVTTIGEGAFEGCGSLTSVTIPDSVTTIGDDVFEHCYSLTSVIIPDSVTTIGDRAFAYCDSLTSVTIPDSVTTIGEGAFYSCKSLTSVTIPDSVTTIGDYAFDNCESLTSVTIPDSVTTIGCAAFACCYRLTSVTIPDSVTTIGAAAFRDCYSLKSVTIPDSVTAIGEWAFADCISLTSVTIPDSVTTIGCAAFAGCDSLTSVTIPDSVTAIGDEAFYPCYSLTSIVVDINNSAYSNDSRGVLFNKNKTMLIQYPTDNTGTSYTIPDSVTTIGDFAFTCCDSLTSVTIPDSVTTIGCAAFAGCDSLTSVTIPDSVTTIGDYAFDNCESLTDVYYQGTEEQWKKINFNSYNGALTSATIHYNSSGKEVTTGYKREHVVDNWKDLNQSYKSEYLAGFAVPMDGTNGNPDYLIPGQSENMIPQGLTYWPEKDWVLVSSYDKSEENPSAIFALDRETGAFVAQFNLKKENGKDWKPHAGGIGVSEHNLYITCDRGVAYFPLSDLDVPSGTVKDITREDYMIVPYLYNADEPDETAYTAYVSVSDGMLWTGNFYSNSTASQILGGLLILPKNWYWEATEDSDSIIVGYELSGDNSKDEWTNLKNSNHAAKHIISVDDSIDCIQGIAFKKISDNTYNMYLSRTTDESFSASISVASVTLNKNDIYLYEEEFKHFINLPGTEGITFIGNDLYAVYESGALGNCDDLVSQVSWSQYFKDWTDVIWKVNESDLLDSTRYKGLTTAINGIHFEEDSINYNHNLGRFCSLFTVIGYDSKATITENLMNCGFTVEGKYIVTNAAQEQVNNFITHKKVLVNGKEYTLVFAGYIGSHKKQWYSNFDPGRGETHKGFINAKNYVYQILENYIKSLGVSKDETIILLTGHSRGAAVSNLVAKQLIDDEKYATKEKVFTYSFATPNSTSLSERKNDKYKRIFNIVNPEDLVTKMIPADWGYGRYGETYTLPSKTNDSQLYTAYKTLMNEKYKLLLNGESYHPYPGGEEQTYNVIYDLTSNVKNINQFYDKNFCWLNTWTTIQEFITNTLCTYLATDGEEKDNAKNLLIKTYLTTIINSKLISSLTNYFVNYQGWGAMTGGLFMDDYFQEAHQPETYCAYMMSMTKEQLQVERKTYNGTINCPVDIEIYDKETGELVGRIVDNIVDEEIAAGENAVVMTVDGDSKSFWLPSNGDYEIKLIGNDEGTMDYTMSEIDSDIGEVKRVNFFDVEITDGLTMTADVEAEEFIIEEHELTFENGETLEPTEILVDEYIETYNINITVSEGGSASSSQTAKSGDYVSLDAIVEEGWKFAGWYENDELISTDTTLTFVAKSDRSLEAKFEHVDHSLCEWYEVTPATCEEKGSEQRDCSECDYSETQEIPAVEHNYEAVITPATCYSNGFTTNTCTKCGNGYTSDITAMLTHNLSDWYTVTDATCEANGTEQRDCSACDYSETQEIPATGHDFDGSECENCHYDKSDDCSCNCHKGGIAGFFFKIILFFQKIFKTNQICEGCGIKHY